MKSKDYWAPWCLPGCPISPFLPPWCLPGASQAVNLYRASLCDIPSHRFTTCKHALAMCYHVYFAQSKDMKDVVVTVLTDGGLVAATADHLSKLVIQRQSLCF